VCGIGAKYRTDRTEVQTLNYPGAKFALQITDFELIPKFFLDHVVSAFSFQLRTFLNLVN
jgi:hypothetical protein